jgi:hypothetical protein
LKKLCQDLDWRVRVEALKGPCELARYSKALGAALLDQLGRGSKTVDAAVIEVLSSFGPQVKVMIDPLLIARIKVRRQCAAKLLSRLELQQK